MSKTKPLAGKTITRTVYLQAVKRQCYHEDYEIVDGFAVSTHNTDYVREGEINLTKAEVTFVVPADFDPVPQMVASIEAEKAKLTAEFTARVSELNKRLSELQAIEHEVPA